jgi:hypothetical protein
MDGNPRTVAVEAASQALPCSADRTGSAPRWFPVQEDGGSEQADLRAASHYEHLAVSRAESALGIRRAIHLPHAE